MTKMKDILKLLKLKGFPRYKILKDLIPPTPHTWFAANNNMITTLNGCGNTLSSLTQALKLWKLCHAYFANRNDKMLVLLR